MFIFRFLCRRVSQGFLIVLIVSALIFSLLRIVPGDPVRLMVGGMAPDSLVEEIATKMGLRDPIPVQFFRYMKGVAQGDLGQSFVRPANGAAVGGASFNDSTRGERAKVFDLIIDAVPKTLQLAFLAMAFGLLIAVPLGIFAGTHPGKWPDKLALYCSSVFVSIPNFWLGIVLALIISVHLKLLPAVGYNGFSYTILPAFVLGVELAPFIIRSLSVSVAGVMAQNFIDIARVRGLSSKQILFKHAVKNASIPVLNMLGVQFSMLLGGVLVIEFIFDYPGIGLLTINAVMQRDFPLIQGIAIVTAAAFVLINIVVDLISNAIDPRLDY